jgi:sodium/hydrogen antiporter
MIPLSLFVSPLFLYSLVSGRLDRTIVTAPIFFTAAGMLLSPALQRIHGTAVNSEIFLGIAEVGLVMILITDASRGGHDQARGNRDRDAQHLCP